ncbi:MAG: hypothetical protein AAF489_03575 [Bacteroidota bacterium]
MLIYVIRLLFGLDEESSRPSTKHTEPYQVFTYRTEDGEAVFKFSYHLVRNRYEIDIHKQPNYRSRKGGSYVAHWLLSPRDAERKICVSTSHSPKTLEDAQELSKAWAELTWEYIKTGISIDTQVAINHKKK